MARLLARDYIDLKIDTDRMTLGKEVAQRLRGTEKGGIPWMVILDGDGKALIDADGPEGNVGCPVSPAERKHFMKMISSTRSKLSTEEVAAISGELDRFGDKILEARKR